MNVVEEIYQWLEDKPVWWRHSIRLALEHGKLESSHFDQICKVAWIEHGLEKPTADFDNTQSPLDISGYMNEENSVQLSSLSGVFGVGALAKDQTISFPKEGLTVIYGDNGSGKSSYAGILKNVCLTRGKIPKIVGNVFVPDFDTPQAKINYEIGDIEGEYSWHAEVSSTASVLKSIRIFDTSSAHHYVSGEDELSYQPIGMSLLTELSRSLNHVKSVAEEDMQPGSGFVNLPKRESSSPTALFINKLSSSNNESEVSHHSATNEELGRIEPVRQELLKLQTQTAKQVKEGLNKQIKLLQPLQKYLTIAFQLMADAAFDRIKQLEINAIEKQDLEKKLRESVLAGLPLNDIASSQWETMWSSAQKFIEMQPTEKNFPPEKGDPCPFCLQDISNSTGERLQKFHEFISNQAIKESRLATNLLGVEKKKALDLKLQLTEYEVALLELENIEVGLKEAIEGFVEKLKVRKELFHSEKLPDSVNELSNQPIEKLSRIITKINEQITSLSSDEGLQMLISKKIDHLTQLEDRKFVLEHQESIIQNILRHKTIDCLKKVKTQCNTRNISTLSSQLNQASVVDPLINNFNQEMKAFGFSRFTISVKSRNKGGQQQFKLELSDAGNSMVATIASEGEQRCIAIACFLAEMKADNRNSAVVFDDPVNSLSHQWSGKVATRLVRESKYRQVIVFTHDIVFYKLLHEAAEQNKLDVNGISLERSRSASGIVRPNPPWDALTTSRRIKALNVELQSLRKIDKEGTEPEFREECRRFYGLLRETCERLVEEKLLNQVVTRFQRGIQTQRLSRLADLRQEDFDKVNVAMGKCSTYFTGHDNAAAMGDSYPNLEEVEQDLADIKEYLDELQGNIRKRS